MVALAVPTLADISWEEERRSRDGLLAFTRRMFPSYRPAPHHRVIADHLEAVERGEIDRLIVTMPPRHGKSTLASEHFPAWYLGRNPDKRVIGCAHTAGLAYRFSRLARNKMTTARWPFNVAPADDLAAVQTWDLAGHRGGYVAAGVGGAIAGYGADLVLVDDPVKNAEQADSAVYRERAWEWWTTDVVTRMEPGAAAVAIGTRWHEDDLIGRLIESGRWTVLHLPALDDAGDALWPEHYPADVLGKIKGEVGSRTWEALYQGRPSPAEGGTFKRGWWQRYRELPPLKRVEQFVDSAFKDGVANDFSVVATWGTDGLGSAYLIDVWRKRVQYPDLMHAVHAAHQKHQERATTVPINVEDKASGQSAIQTLRRPLPQLNGTTLPALPVIPYPIKAGESKQGRAEAVSPLVESGRVFIPGSAPWLDDWVAEHDGFPYGKHDDQVDTTSMALSRLLRRGSRGGLA